jgi:hypothetical protein
MFVVGAYAVARPPIPWDASILGTVLLTDELTPTGIVMAWDPQRRAERTAQLPRSKAI